MVRMRFPERNPGDMADHLLAILRTHPFAEDR
jgi:hypothetical protein